MSVKQTKDQEDLKEKELERTIHVVLKNFNYSIKMESKESVKKLCYEWENFEDENLEFLNITNSFGQVVTFNVKEIVMIQWGV